MTGKTYKPELKYDHISHVLVTTVYGLLWDWVYGRVQGMVSMDPLNLRFAFNFIIDYNLVSPADIYERLKGILGVRELPVVDESYVSKNCEDALYSFEVGCLPRVNSEI